MDTETIATEEEVKRDLEEELFARTGILVRPVVGSFFDVVDVGGETDRAFVTVAFIPPPAKRDPNSGQIETIGQGTFHMTFRVEEGELVLVDYLAESR